MTIITVKTGGIAADAVTDAKIADDVVGTEHLTANEVDTAALGADAVTAAQIADDAISEEHLDVTAITGHTAETTVADGDLVVVHDASASALRKMTVANLVANAGGGKIGQVVSTVKTDVFGTTSTSFTDVTGLSVAITPAATSSKILILTDFKGSLGVTSSVTAFLQLLRASTAIYNMGVVGIATDNFQTYSGGMFLDSPNSDSEQTYKIQMKGDGQLVGCNRLQGNTTDRSDSSITVMEILA